MVNNINFHNVTGLQQQGRNSGNSGGITPEFFGPPGPMDRKKDMNLCQQLGIQAQGMDRNTVKANILSKLTGKPVDQMKEFYSSVGEQDMRKDMQNLKSMGMQPSHQPNIMMARGENKAKIANGWINKNNQNPGINGNNQQSANRPGDPMVNSMLDMYGLKNTGSLLGDIYSLTNFLINSQMQQQSLNGISHGKRHHGHHGNQFGGQQNTFQDGFQNGFQSPFQGGPQGAHGGHDGPLPGPPPAVLNLMNTVGVTPSGSKDGDYAAVMDKISQMEAQAHGPAGKMRAQMLMMNALAVFASAR